LDEAWYQSDKNNFAPRIGLAYQVNSNTVVRAGYGRFNMTFERAGSEDQLALNLPFLVNNVVSSANNNQTANNMRLASGFNLSLDPNSILNDPTKVILVRLRAVNPDSVDGPVDQWNLGVQREIRSNIVVTFDYVGTKGTHLSTLRNLNQPFFNSNGTVTNVIGPNGQPTPLLPYPLLGPIEYRENNANSMYNGGELSVEEVQQGPLLRASYTFSKSIDEAQEHLAAGGTGSFTQNPANVLGERRGLSDFDVTHRFVASYVYELPFGRGRSYVNSGVLAEVLGDWRLSGIVNVRTGRPFTLNASANDATIGGPRGGPAWRDCLRDGTLDNPTIDRWFDPTAYAVPSAPNPTKNNTVEARLGTCGRNTLRGPGYNDFSFNLAREFNYFGEGRHLEFRWEVFNAFNSPQFGLPTGICLSGTAGVISTLSGDPRVMQFALRFVF
jgi:hypothetical protein